MLTNLKLFYFLLKPSRPTAEKKHILPKSIFIFRFWTKINVRKGISEKSLGKHEIFQNMQNFII